MKCSDMAKVTLGFIKILFSLYYLLIIYMTSCRDTKALHIKIYILHIFGTNIQLSIRKSHHATLVYLRLSLTDFLRIATHRFSGEK